jgi:hypothetical protein
MDSFHQGIWFYIKYGVCVHEFKHKKEGIVLEYASGHCTLHYLWLYFVFAKFDAVAYVFFCPMFVYIFHRLRRALGLQLPEKWLSGSPHSSSVQPLVAKTLLCLTWTPTWTLCLPQ